MNALNMTAGHAELRRLAGFRMTLGARVALTFALLFLMAGAVLLAVNYLLFAHGLQGWAGGPVQTYTASFVAKYDRGLISNPQTPASMVAAARGQLARGRSELAHRAEHPPRGEPAQRDGQHGERHQDQHGLPEQLAERRVIAMTLRQLGAELRARRAERR